MRFRSIGLFAILSVAILASVSVNHAAVAFDQNITPDVIFGAGNANGSWTVDRANGIELGLRIKQRNPAANVFNSNGDGTYSFATSPLFDFWNFEWSVNSDFNGMSGLLLADLTYELAIDFDPTTCTNFLAWDHVNVPGVIPFTVPVAVPSYDHAIGTNATGNGGGTSNAATYPVTYPTVNVAQNSWRHAFFTAPPYTTFDPSIDATWDVRLTAFDAAGDVAASVTIQAIIGAGGDPCGACCSDGPLTASDCEEKLLDDCNAEGGLYVGDGVTCATVGDCEPLLVEFDSVEVRDTPQGVLLTWTTSTEIDTIGFRVLRESGTREKTLTSISKTIPAIGGGLLGASYQFLDNDRRRTDGVRYWLEDIDIQGRTTRHGPFTVQPRQRTRASRN